MNSNETLASVDDDQAIAAAIEAVLLVATEPVEPAVLAQLVEIPTATVIARCEALAVDYARDGRGFTIARVAGGYRFQTVAAQAPYVERFVLEGQVARLSGPALETLAIVAYKQPISRGQLSAIRGVNVDATLRTLVQRGYVEESGHEATPGNPALFATTRTFLEKLGVNSLADLPVLAEFIPDANVVEALERGLRVVGSVDDFTAPAQENAASDVAAIDLRRDEHDDVATPAEMMEQLGMERVSIAVVQSMQEAGDNPTVALVADDVAANLADGLH